MPPCSSSSAWPESSSFTSSTDTCRWRFKKKTPLDQPWNVCLLCFLSLWNWPEICSYTFVGIDIFSGRIQAIRMVPYSGPVWILFHFWPCRTSTHAGQTQEVRNCTPLELVLLHTVFTSQKRILIQVITLLSRIPGKTYMIIAFLTVGTMGLSNTSLGYLNYPTQVIFKCCKLIPVMIGGMFIQGKWNQLFFFYFFPQLNRNCTDCPKDLHMNMPCSTGKILCHPSQLFLKVRTENKQIWSPNL